MLVEIHYNNNKKNIKKIVAKVNLKEITKSYLIAIKIHALLRVPFKDKSTKYIVYLYTSLLTLIN